MAKGYQQSDSKIQYVIKYGIADHLKKQLIYGVKNTPYSFLFDETTNSQIKTIYGYVTCWSKISNSMSIYADRYLLDIARLSIWLSIMRNLWIRWTLIHSSCFILGTNVLLNLSSESKLTHRSGLRWIHSSSSWDHIHAIQFTPHFRGGLDSFFWDRFHQQHLTVKVLEEFLRREELLIRATFSLTSIPFLDFLVLDVRITLPKKVLLVLLQSMLKSIMKHAGFL